MKIIGLSSLLFWCCVLQLCQAAGRSLQPNFTAQYVGRFQHLHDRFCFGPAPVLRAACTYGTVRVTNTSDPSIQCSSTLKSDTGTSLSNFIECTNTCTPGTSCANIYENIGGSIENGPFGEVYFECSGVELRDAEGIFAIAPSTVPFSCNDNTVSPTTRNFQVVRLAVNCAGDYVVDDFYAECRVPDFALNVGGEYTCLEGGDCDNGRSCETNFDGMITNSDIEHIQEDCVVPNVPITPAPVSSPGSSQFRYSVDFVARWALRFSNSMFSGCNQNAPKVEITCEGGSLIESLGTTQPTITCSLKSPSVLECTDSGSSFVNQLEGVSYRCVGPGQPPDSKVEYLADESVSCDGNPSSLDVSHAVQMGIVCDLGAGDQSVFLDAYIDCGEVGHEFAIENGGRVTCIEKVPFTGSSGIQTIPSVSIMTDYRWSVSPDTGCFEETERAQPGTPTAAPIASPTQAPSTPNPTSAPTKSPTSAPPITAAPTSEPTSSPTKSPTLIPAVPTTTPFTSPTRPPEEPPSAGTSAPNQAARGGTGDDDDDDGGNTVAIIAGAVIGAVAIIAITAYFSIRVWVTGEKGSKKKDDVLETEPGTTSGGDLFYRHSTSTPYHEPSLPENSHFDDQYEPSYPTDATNRSPFRLSDTRQDSGRSRPSYSWTTDNSSIPRQGSGRTTQSGYSGQSRPPLSSQGGSGRSRPSYTTQGSGRTAGTGVPTAYGMASTGMPSHEVRFKDQAQTVISAEEIAPIPMVEAEAVAVPFPSDTGTSSQHTSGSGQSHRSAEPSGAIMEDVDDDDDEEFA